MAARQAAGTGELAGLVRERQDLVDLWRAEDRKLTALLAVPPDRRDERRVEEVRGKLTAADRRIGDAQSDVWTIKQRIAEVDMSLSAFDISSDERADLLAERRALVEERARVERSLSTLVAEKQRADEALASYRTNLPEASGGAVRPSNASY